MSVVKGGKQNLRGVVYTFSVRNVVDLENDQRNIPGLRNVFGTGAVLLDSCEILMLSPLSLPRLALLPLLPVILVGPTPVAAAAFTGSNALLIPSGRKLFRVVPDGNKRLLSTSSLCAARNEDASWSETLTT
jgi:hypothetical protein